MNEQLQKIALKALSLGWSIIPCGKDKRPLIVWREFQNRRPTEDEIKNWFIKYPEMNIAVVTGQISNLVVIDQELGADFSLIKDKTFKVRTQGGGIHWYFQFDPDIKNSVRILPLTDTRGTGGYCLTIGSKTDKGEYTILDDCLVAKMSQATKDLLLTGKKPVILPSAQQSIPTQQVGDELFDYPGFPSGQRNQEMVKIIGVVLSSTHPARWNDVAWPLIQSFNQRNQPPLSDAELLASFNSIRNREISSAPDKWSKKSEEQLKKEQEILLDDSLALMKLVADEQSKELDISTPMATGYKKVDDALRGGFRIGDLIILSGLTGHGKTLVASNIAVNMAERGEPVMFLTYEVFTAEVWAKMKEMGVSDDIKIFTPKCYTSGRIEWIKKKIHEGKEYGIKFIVIDHLEFLSNSGDKYAKNVNLNFSTAISEVVKEVKTLAKTEGVCILLLCHLRKMAPGGRPSINDLKDTSSIGQEADAVLLIERIVGGEKSDEVFSPLSFLSLQKNRRTGKTCYDELLFTNGRMVETLRVELDKKNSDAKEATGDTSIEPTGINPIQDLLSLGFGGAQLDKN